MKSTPAGDTFCRFEQFKRKDYTIFAALKLIFLLFLFSFQICLHYHPIPMSHSLSTCSVKKMACLKDLEKIWTKLICQMHFSRCSNMIRLMMISRRNVWLQIWLRRQIISKSFLLIVKQDLPILTFVSHLFYLVANLMWPTESENKQICFWIQPKDKILISLLWKKQTKFMIL